MPPMEGSHCVARVEPGIGLVGVGGQQEGAYFEGAAPVVLATQSQDEKRKPTIKSCLFWPKIESMLCFPQIIQVVDVIYPDIEVQRTVDGDNAHQNHQQMGEKKRKGTSQHLRRIHVKRIRVLMLKEIEKLLCSRRDGDGIRDR
ncbi:hypothetical protein QJS04_geneDACA023355 [Acorus gramineus]|uniref:Uncharacterized protein n=1 Tax=Acorus gramineus TaxID=55184 RepID=A0AAV9BNA8_ACOGR|nr:hypothetical protein QJS04_geneDACA023355 [Acorus gramineus]